MRTFRSEDGKTWTAKLHEDEDATVVESERVGWEIVEFDSEPLGQVQRITYRPAGWLASATLQELIKALLEGDSVRAHWRE